MRDLRGEVGSRRAGGTISNNNNNLKEVKSNKRGGTCVEVGERSGLQRDRRRSKCSSSELKIKGFVRVCKYRRGVERAINN